MFCRNCGKENAEGVSFCIGCGAPLATTEQAPEYAPAAAPAAPVSFKLDQKKLGLLAGIVAGVVAFVLLLVLIFGGTPNSAEGVAEAYVVAQLEYDVDALVDCMSEMSLLDYSKELGYKQVNEDAIVDKLEEQVESMEKIAGDTMYVDYDIVKVEIDEDWKDAGEYFEEFEEEYGKEVAGKITAMKKVKVTVKVTVAGNSNETTRNVYCVEEDGDWKVYER